MNDTVQNDTAQTSTYKNPLLDDGLSAMTKGGVYFDVFMADSFRHVGSENQAALRGSFSGQYAASKSKNDGTIKYDEQRSQVEKLFSMPHSNRQLVDAYTTTLIGAVNDKEAAQGMTNMQVGGIYFDVFMADSFQHVGSENAEALRSSFAGLYATLKNQNGETEIDYNAQRAHIEKFFTMPHSNRQLVDAYTNTLIGAVKDDKLPELVATEIEYQKKHGRRTSVRQEQPTVVEPANANVPTESRATRNWRKFRNFCAAATLLVTGACGVILFNQNKELSKQVKQGTEQVGNKVDSTSNATQDVINNGNEAIQDKMKHDHDDMWNSDAKTRRMINNLKTEVQGNTIRLDSLNTPKVQ